MEDVGKKRAQLNSISNLLLADPVWRSGARAHRFAGPRAWSHLGWESIIDNDPVPDFELFIEPLGGLVVAQLAATVRASLVALVGKVL